MNYLAHLYLSGDSEELIIGNFIADSVKGNQINKYSEGIRQGIILHRMIDSFTDSHPIVTQSKKRLREKYKKYSGIIVDIFYDHFLALDWKADIKMLLCQNGERPFREYCMTPYERKVFRSLPQSLTLCRGMTIAEFEGKDFGLSWTLSEKVAEYFAFTYRRNFATNDLPKMVHKIKIDKKFAIAYLSGRKEKEVLLDVLKVKCK